MPICALFIYLSLCLSVCASVCLSAYLCVRPSVCLSAVFISYRYVRKSIERQKLGENRKVGQACKDALALGGGGGGVGGKLFGLR